MATRPIFKATCASGDECELSVFTVALQDDSHALHLRSEDPGNDKVGEPPQMVMVRLQREQVRELFNKLGIWLHTH